MEKSVMQQIHWSWKEFHHLSVDELYQLMQLRQRGLLHVHALQTPDADGNDPLAWHLSGYHPQAGLVACARLCLPDLENSGESSEESPGRRESEAASIVVDRLFVASPSSFKEPHLNHISKGLNEALISEVLGFATKYFKLPVYFEVFDDHLNALRQYADRIVDRTAALPGAVCLRVNEAAPSE